MVLTTSRTQIKYVPRCQVEIRSLTLHFLLIRKKHTFSANVPESLQQRHLFNTFLTKRMQEELCRTHDVNREGVINDASVSKGSSRTGRPRASE